MSDEWTFLVIPSEFINNAAMTSTLAVSITVWLHEQVGLGSMFSRRFRKDVWWWYKDQSLGYRIAFKDPKAALLFKLTWL